MTGLHTALNTYIESWKRPGANKPPDNVQKAAEDLLKKVDETCRKFANPQQCGERGPGLGTAGPPLVYTPPSITQRLGQLLGGVESYTAGPTAWQLDQIKLLQGMLTDANTAAQKLSKDDLAALNKMINDAGIPHIVVPGAGRQGAGPRGDGDDEEEP